LSRVRVWPSTSSDRSTMINLRKNFKYLWLEFIKLFCVFSQNHFLMLVAQVFAFFDFIDLIQSILHGNFVGEVRCKHACWMPSEINDIGQCPFAPFATDVKSATVKVVNYWLLTAQLAVFPFPI